MIKKAQNITKRTWNSWERRQLTILIKRQYSLGYDYLVLSFGGTFHYKLHHTLNAVRFNDVMECIEENADIIYDCKEDTKQVNQITYQLGQNIIESNKVWQRTDIYYAEDMRCKSRLWCGRRILKIEA